MISVPTRTRFWNARTWGVIWDDPARACWWTSYGLITALSVTVIARRILGGLDQRLLAGQFVGLCLVVAISCVLMRNTARRAGVAMLREMSAMAIAASLTVCGLLFVLALSLPGTSVLGLVAGWAIIVGIESSWWTNFVARRLSHAPAPTRAADEACLVRATAEPDDIEELNDEVWPAGVTQQLTRLRNESGGEMIVGGVRVDFAPAERQRAVHISFCPPLDGPPQFHIEQSEGPEVTVDVTQCEPFGVRLEVKRQQVSQQHESVVLQFEAVREL